MLNHQNSNQSVSDQRMQTLHSQQNEVQSSTSSSSSSSSLYALCARVPLIKSPAVRIAAPIGLPNNIHPLPNNVEEYFVYPFNLEQFVLEAASRREQARRQDLLKRAPGWSEGADVLQPTTRHQQSDTATGSTMASNRTQTGSDTDELGQMLDRLENL